MKSAKEKSGISLIVLVITIIVIVILAVAVILTISNNNPIENANKATFQNDLKTMQEDVNMYALSEYADNKGEGYGNLDFFGESMVKEFPSTSNYKDKVKIIRGEVVLLGDAVSEKEKEWASELGIQIQEDGSNMAAANAPVILTGMTPIKFSENGTAIDTQSTDINWYAYTDQGSYGTDGKSSRWANARTEDGSQWVWIPRYAYKITNPGTNTASEIDVIFLKGTSNKYIDENGVEKEIPEGYVVHPAFTDESGTNYQNGGWDKELPGIWVSKYEAGYAGVGSITSVEAKESNLTYTGTCAGSNIYGSITSGTTKIKYPVFLPNAYSYNYINMGDSYAICRALGESGNPYGLTSGSEAHLMKNSEWGAVAYLTQSKYGRNGVEITINNKNLNNNPSTIYAVTGYSNGTNNTYETSNGQLASTTGNLYGVYDMSGGVWERTAGYLNNDNGNLKTYGKSMTDLNNDGNVDKEATKYIAIYKKSDSRRYKCK